MRPLNQLARSSTCAALILFFASCGQSGLSDDPTGFIDLVPFYPVTSAPGVVPANPNANLPLVMTPRRGWFAGQRVEYYDFGPVGNVRKRNAAGSEIREPSYANVFPMYFFFDGQGRPMFSKPAFNSQNGNWYMLGGKNPINPTPQGPPASGQERTDYYSTVYLRRPRNVLTDDARGSSEFQRPVIDNLSVNATTANTTGLFEVVEITVKDGGYRPDAIKTATTIAKGVADGRLSQRNTGKVINCPLVDERTNIVPSAMNNNIPRPRIQYWYKQKMGECFLANGWETIGELVDENQSAKDPANLRLFGPGDLDKRISTFDSFDFDVGAGQPGATHATVAGVSRVYMPLLPTTTGLTRATNDALFTALPRHKATDPPGYSPIAWLYRHRHPGDDDLSTGQHQGRRQRRSRRSDAARLGARRHHQQHRRPRSREQVRHRRGLQVGHDLQPDARRRHRHRHARSGFEHRRHDDLPRGWPALRRSRRRLRSVLQPRRQSV